MKIGLRILAALSLAIPLSAQAAKVVFINKSSWNIHEVYVGPSTQRAWGEDRLGSAILENGDSLTLTGVSRGKWDFLLIDEDGDKCELLGVQIDGNDRWEITDDDLLGCQAGS